MLLSGLIWKCVHYLQQKLQTVFHKIRTLSELSVDCEGIVLASTTAIFQTRFKSLVV